MQSFLSSDITEQYLNKLYEDMHKEQLHLINAIKTAVDNTEKAQDTTKQITQINQIMMAALRLRNLRKTALTRLNS